MDFKSIKPVVKQALMADGLTSTEAEVIRSAVLSDANKERANLLVELLGLGPASPMAEG